MKKTNPAAFLSYVHTDDKYGQVSTLLERLSDEVGMQIGIEFPIFQDRKDIEWGQNWERRIEASLDEVTFLIPIITPGFFNSANCRKELRRFLDREQELNRADLILPVYFVDTPLLNEEELRAEDELAQAIASRQWADWRDLRFEPFTNPQVGKTLERLARQIRDALPRVKPPTKATESKPVPAEAQPAEFASDEGGEQKAQSSPAKNEPPTRVVDQLHRGDFTTIKEAIEKSEPGTRVLVRPGFYQEGLVIDKPLEILGEGRPGEVLVQASAGNVILFRTTMGRVSNLMLRQAGGGNWFAVDIAQGRVELEGCDITSQSSSCVAIRNGADPILRRNRIHGGELSGVFIDENGRGTLEDNDIYGNRFHGVVIKGGRDPVVRRNRIHKNGWAGIRVYLGGGGTFEDNDLRGNVKRAWSIAADCEANVKRENNQE